MKYEVVYSPRARDHLNNIYDYIAEHAGALIARRFTSQIEKRCSDLDHFPMRGTPRDDIRSGLRTIAHRRRSVIVYSIESGRVVIHGIFYGGRDYEATVRGTD